MFFYLSFRFIIRVNLTMSLVPPNANFAVKILLLLKYIVKIPVINVLKAVRPKKVAPNALIALPVNLKT